MRGPIEDCPLSEAGESWTAIADARTSAVNPAANVRSPLRLEAGLTAVRCRNARISKNPDPLHTLARTWSHVLLDGIQIGTVSQSIEVKIRPAGKAGRQARQHIVLIDIQLIYDPIEVDVADAGRL